MNLFKDILRGVVIGIANAIPGVSGGTMMVSMGIYDKLIYSVTHLFKQPVKSIKTLLPYFIGMAIGIVGLAFAIVAMFEHIPFQTCMLFIGLILGGVPILTGHLKGVRFNLSHAVVFLIFFGSIILLQIFGGHGSDVALTVTPICRYRGCGYNGHSGSERFHDAYDDGVLLSGDRQRKGLYYSVGRI